MLYSSVARAAKCVWEGVCASQTYLMLKAQVPLSSVQAEPSLFL